MQTTVTPNYLPAPAGPHFGNETRRELESAIYALIALGLPGRQLPWPVIGKSANSRHLESDQWSVRTQASEHA